MSHSTKIVDSGQEPTQAVYFADFECCGSHKYRHSFHREVLLDAEKMKASLAEGHKAAAASHEAEIKAEEIIAGIKGQTQEHP